MSKKEMRDPSPWVHVSGVRVTDPKSPESPKGGYTYLPRKGYSDYPDRYIPVDRGIRPLKRPR